MKPFALSPPQVIASSFLDTHPDALLLLSVGLGKTSLILHTVKDLIALGLSKAALIVAPLNVATLTWPNEVAAFDAFRSLRIASLRTKEGKAAFKAGTADLYVINWESLHLVGNMLKEMGGTVPYDTVIFDEITKAKGHSSITIARYLRTCPRVARHIGMTGTPVSENYMGLWGQMRLVDGGKRLGRSFNLFRETYFQPTDWQKYKWVLKEGAAEAIQKRISDITLTLRSSDWFDLPDVVLHDIEVPFPRELEKQYNQFEKDLIMEVKGRTVNAVNAAALVTKLLQFTSGAIYDEERVVCQLHDLKVRALESVARQADGPLLVAYGFIHERERIREAFPKAVFFQDAKEADRPKLLADWNAGKIKMLCAHCRNISHGLNMQGGHNLCWYTLPHSRDVYDQLIGRLHRRGQHEVVHVYRLMAPGTIDWSVAECLRAKDEQQSLFLRALQSLEAFRAAGGTVELDFDDAL